MTANNEYLDKAVDRGMPDGLGDENTQPGPPMTHTIEPDSLVYGLGSAETQSDASDPGHLAIDHSYDGAESGLPLGLGSEDSQDGPPMVHIEEPEATEFGMGSPETQEPHVS